MLHFPLAKTIVGRSRRLCACFNASLYGTGSPPPVANAVDRVLNKAASKVKIVHPYANKLRQEKLEGQIKLSTAHKTAPRAKLHRPPRPLSQVDDDSLLADITDADRDIERKPLRVEIDQSSSGKWLKDDVSTSGRHALPQRRRASPNAREERSAFMTPSSSQPLSSTSGFKGFGTLPRQPSSASTNALSQSHVPSTSSRTSKTQPTLPSRNSRSNSASRALSASTTAATQRASSSQQHKPNSSVRSVSSRNPAPPALLRLFLFNAEAAQTRELLQQLGLSDRVTVVEDVQSANAIVAAKLARSGKHVKLAQGERTAVNAGVPFLVVGRHMSADNLNAALAPLLDPQAARTGEGRGTGFRRPTAAELQAYRLETALGFARVMREAAGVGSGVESGSGDGSY